jgi:hypothetical protein
MVLLRWATKNIWQALSGIAKQIRVSGEAPEISVAPSKD